MGAVMSDVMSAVMSAEAGGVAVGLGLLPPVVGKVKDYRPTRK